MTETFEPDAIRIVQIDRRWIRASLAAAAVGLVLLVVGWVVEPTRAAFAYLVAFVTCLTTCLGALIFLAIVHAMNAKWPTAIRRFVEALCVPLVVLVVLFVPIGVGLELYFPWAWPPARLPEHLAALLARKQPWFAPGFFWLRAALYFGVWLLVAALLLRWSARQDRDADMALRIKQRWLAAGSLPALGLTATFAAFDWIMSLDPAWYSSMFGVAVFAGGFIAALALLTISVTLADRRGDMLALLRPSHYYALGRLLLAFVVFWAYVTFFQFMLIWLANKPEEVAWYIERSHAGWQWVALTVIILHFLAPFLVLLSYAIKWRPRALAVIAGVIALGHWIEIHWMIVPAAHPRWIVHWVDVGAIMLVAGLCVAVALSWLHNRPAAPRLDPTLPKGARYDSV
jgi:hypothetical protein